MLISVSQTVTKKQKEKKLLPNDSVSLLKVTKVLVSSVLLWKASLYI